MIGDKRKVRHPKYIHEERMTDSRGPCVLGRCMISGTYRQAPLNALVRQVLLCPLVRYRDH
jgi:hypothetical protein